jgi:NitT/TauT family transport system substrate-binding protein
MRPDEMLDALIKGRVDAVATWYPNRQLILKALGKKGIIFYNEAIYTETFCLAAQKDFVKARPETIKKVLRALIRAETFVQQKQDESRRLVSESSKIDKALIDEMWDAYNFKITLTQSLLVNLEDQTRWALKKKLTASKDMPNYLDFIYADGLSAVKPEAVRILR